MSPGYVLTAEATANINDIASFVAQDGIEAALRVLDAGEHALEMIGDVPGVGHSRPDLTERPMKFWPVHSYLVVYDPASSLVRILAVLHGAREVERVLLNLPV